MKTHLTPIGALLIYVILLAIYSFCIWQTAIVVHPIQQEMEIIELIVGFGTGVWVGMYISSQIEKKIDKNVKKQNKND